MAWQTASGHASRVLAEATIARWERVIGDGLRAYGPAPGGQVAVAFHALNRIPELGRPSCVRIA